MTHYANLGVDVFYDNVKVAKSCRVLFLMVLPTQLTRLVNELKRQLRRRCFVVSFVLGVTEERLQSQFLTSTVFARPRCVRSDSFLT